MYSIKESLKKTCERELSTHYHCRTNERFPTAQTQPSEDCIFEKTPFQRDLEKGAFKRDTLMC